MNCGLTTNSNISIFELFNSIWVNIDNINIIHLGDSRIQAYKSIKGYLGFDDTKESIYARFSTGYDDYFKSHMSSAKSEMNKNPNTLEIKF